MSFFQRSPWWKRRDLVSIALKKDMILGLWTGILSNVQLPQLIPTAYVPIREAVMSARCAAVKLCLASKFQKIFFFISFYLGATRLLACASRMSGPGLNRFPVTCLLALFPETLLDRVCDVKWMNDLKDNTGEAGWNKTSPRPADVLNSLFITRQKARGSFNLWSYYQSSS